MAGKELRDSANNSGSVDTVRKYISDRSSTRKGGQTPLRLAFEVFHDVKEPIVDIRLLVELYLDLVQVAQSVLNKVLGQPWND